jgi:hypothetical protein
VATAYDVRMDLLSVEDFLAWAGTHGIAFDPRFRRAADLTFIAAPDCWRSWPLTFGPRRLPLFLATILEAATAPAWLLYPRAEGRWDAGSTATFGDELLALAARGARIPLGFIGAVRFTSDVPAEVVELLSASLVHGGHVGDDLYAVAADASCILMASHHDELIAKFPTAERLSHVSALVAKDGYDS